MTTAALFWLLVGGLVTACLSAIGAKSLRDFSRHELEDICERRGARRRLSEILRRYDRVAVGVESLQAITSALFVVAAAFWTWSVWGDGSAAGVAIVLVVAFVCGLLLVAATNWIPWAVVVLWAEPFLFHTWRMWRLAAALMAPLVWGERLVEAVMHRIAGQTPEAPSEESIEEEIRAIVSEGHREGLLEEDAREMIEGVIELDNVDVADIMTPRGRMRTMHVDLPWDEMLRFVNSVPHTRIPVYDTSRDDIVGTLHTKDLLPILSRDDAPPPLLRDILRAAIFVPGSKRLDDLLEQFQKTRNHIAIVRDEYDRVSGLVTIEDVLEEIVGEIVDEHDLEEPAEIVRTGDGVFEAMGHTHLEDVNDRLALELPTDGEVDSIGGLVVHRLGRIPRAGDHVLYDGVRLTVLSVTRRRVERLRIERLDRANRETV